MKKTDFQPQKIVENAAKKMRDYKQPLVKSPVKVPFQDK